MGTSLGKGFHCLMDIWVEGLTEMFSCLLQRWNEEQKGFTAGCVGG